MTDHEAAVGTLEVFLSRGPLGDGWTSMRLGPHVWRIVRGNDRRVVRTGTPQALVLQQELLGHLQGEGIRRPEILAIYPVHADEAWGVYTDIPGSPLELETAYDRSADLGAELGHLHRSLVSFPPNGAFPTRNLASILREGEIPRLRISPDPAIQALLSLLTNVAEVLRDRGREPCQLIHRDVHRQNLVDDGDHGFGWLDFDLVETNATLFDVAYFGTAILAEGFDRGDLRERWATAFHAFVQAYGYTREMPPPEPTVLKAFLVGIEGLFVGLSLSSEPSVADRNAEICQWLWDRFPAPR